MIIESKKAGLKSEGKNGCFFSLELPIIFHEGSLPIEKLTANIIHNAFAPL